MADITITLNDGYDDCDEGVFEQGDGSPPGSRVDEDSLPPLVRIQKYAQSEHFNDRQIVWRILVDLFRTAPLDSMTTSLPSMMNIVAAMAEDQDKAIRKRFLEQVPNLAVVAKECRERLPILENIVIEHFLPMIVKNLGVEENLVRRSAQTALFELIEGSIISIEEAELHVCPTIIALTKENLTDYHIGAITLMSKIAALLGAEVTERIFLDRIAELCSNQTFYVRKVCASHFGDFCSIVGKEAYERVLLPCYIRLCGDEVWGVRKACADVVMAVSCACPPTVRRVALAPVFAKLLQDTSRWVRMSAFQSLGPFISTFADPAMSSLFYNNLGELMLVNTDGREFRVNSMSHRILPLRAYEDCDFDADDDLGKATAFLFGIPSKSSDMDGVDSMMTADVPIEEEIVDDVVVADTVEVTDMDKKREEVIIQKNFNVISKAMFGEVLVDNPNLDDGDDVLLLPREDSPDIKEIVETVKNAVLNFRGADGGDTSKNCDNNCDTSKEIDGGNERGRFDGDKLNEEGYEFVLKRSRSSEIDGADWKRCKVKEERIKCKDVATEGGGGDCQEVLEFIISQLPEGEGEKEKNQEETVVGEDELHQYNSYNFWYISPEMPVDVSIIEKEEEFSNNFSVNYVTQTDHLNSVFSSMSLDDAINNTTIVEKSVSPSEETVAKDATFVKVDEKNPEEDGDRNVPQLLIDHFTSMTNPNLAQNTDNEMAFHCAYSLPAVALTLGSKNWHLLSSTVETLASDVQYKVRRTVASSLHELAFILGPEIATNCLTPIFDGFINDLDEVRIGVLKHLAHFLRLISPTERTTYLPRLAKFLQADNELNWRFRQELADQLRMAVPLFRPLDTAKHIVHIATTLLNDRVASVRETALALITELIRHIAMDPHLAHRLLIMLAERFAHSKKWKCRQTFTLICSAILVAEAIPPEVFAADVMPHLLDLSWDPVVNVRLVVARTISRDMISHSYFADPTNQHVEGLETVIRRLQADKDRDVRHSASMDVHHHPVVGDDRVAVGGSDG